MWSSGRARLLPTVVESLVVQPWKGDSDWPGVRTPGQSLSPFQGCTTKLSTTVGRSLALPELHIPARNLLNRASRFSGERACLRLTQEQHNWMFDRLPIGASD